MYPTNLFYKGLPEIEVCILAMHANCKLLTDSWPLYARNNNPSIGLNIIDEVFYLEDEI